MSTTAIKVTEGLTTDRILSLASREGGFFVSLRWRDDTLRSRCMRLVKEGRLKQYREGRRRIFKGYVIFTT